MFSNNQKVCLDCQFCCKYLVIHTIQKDPEKFRNQIDFNLIWGNVVVEYENGYEFETAIPYACRFLTRGGCKIYEERPIVCKRFNGFSESVIMQRNCNLFKMKLKEKQDAETGDSQADRKK